MKKTVGVSDCYTYMEESLSFLIKVFFYPKRGMRARIVIPSR